jgi:hypothetical protein
MIETIAAATFAKIDLLAGVLHDPGVGRNFLACEKPTPLYARRRNGDLDNFLRWQSGSPL